MKKRNLALLLALTMVAASFVGCGDKKEKASDNGTALLNFPIIRSSSRMISLFSGYRSIKSSLALISALYGGFPARIDTDIASSRS